MRWIRILRILCFAIVYFSIHLTYVVFFMIRAYSGITEATLYFQHPLKALRIMLFELSHSPRLLMLFSISLSGMIAWALLLGFVTDWGLTILRKHVLHRKKRVE